MDDIVERLRDSVSGPQLDEAQKERDRYKALVVNLHSLLIKAAAEYESNPTHPRDMDAALTNIGEWICEAIALTPDDMDDYAVVPTDELKRLRVIEANDRNNELEAHMALQRVNAARLRQNEENEAVVMALKAITDRLDSVERDVLEISKIIAHSTQDNQP